MGSGALVVGLATAAPTADAALAFLLAFGLLSTLTMAAVATVWARALERGLADHLKATAALLGIAVGVLLLGEKAGVGPV